MARIPRELTPEEKERLIANNKRQYSIVAAVIWLLSSVAWIVTLCIDFANENPLLTTLMHGFCAVATAACAVMHFIGWRKMKKAAETEDSAPVEGETSDTP